MQIVWKILERLMLSVAISFITVIAVVSSVTGKFPPAKDDMKRIFILGKKVIEQNQAMKQAQAGMKPTEEGEASLEQIVQFQKMNYERMQTIHEFSKLVKIFPQGPGNEQIAQQLRIISDHLEKAENSLLFVQEEIKKHPPVSL